jgi:hypothetical protein
MVDAEILSFISNQGLAVGVSIFLIYWVTNEVSKVLNKIANKLDEIDRRMVDRESKLNGMCEKVDRIYDAIVVK